MTAAMTCLAPFIGLATSLDTLCAQAYGDGRKHLVGLQCQRCFWFLLIMAVPVAVLWTFSESILIRIVDAETAKLSAQYLRIMIFSIPSYVAFESGKRLLQAQGLFREISYIIVTVAPINIFVNWFLVWKLELGFIGAPIGVVISRNLLAALLILYVKFVNGYQCWGGFDWKAFVNWGAMIKLALPGMTMVLAEWLAFELITLLSSRFGTDYLAAQSAIFTIVALLYQIPFSVSVACSTRVASLIGGGIIDSAKLAAELVSNALFESGHNSLINCFSVCYCVVPHQCLEYYTLHLAALVYSSAADPGRCRYCNYCKDAPRRCHRRLLGRCQCGCPWYPARYRKAVYRWPHESHRPLRCCAADFFDAGVPL